VLPTMSVNKYVTVPVGGGLISGSIPRPGARVEWRGTSPPGGPRRYELRRRRAA
jgi:hypothetical protein